MGVYSTEIHSDKTLQVLHHRKLRNVLMSPSQENVVLAMRPGLQISVTSLPECKKKKKEKNITRAVINSMSLWKVLKSEAITQTDTMSFRNGLAITPKTQTDTSSHRHISPSSKARNR